MQAIGIDIGTTTICGIRMDAENGSVLDVRTLPNDAAAVQTEEAFARIQDPDRIWRKVQQIYREFTENDRQIACVGITGQMHGILYTDANGAAVSPLYTWQDERGNEIYKDGRSYAEVLTELTGYRSASGFGLTTHYYNVKNDLVPEKAYKLVTIQDYIVMKLTGNSSPLLSASNAASLGLFDLEQLCFDVQAVVKAGMDPQILPEVTAAGKIAGKTEEGIPVSCGIGDNQASVIGSVKNVTGSILCNVGTGSQISVGVSRFVPAKEVELRPLDRDQYILVGASLCGGRAYATLEQFFRNVTETMTGKPCDPLYSKMEQLLELPEKEPELQVDTRFCGTRKDPGLTGGIYGLTLENFTAVHLIRGVLNGIAEELQSYYKEMITLGADTPTALIGSGNGIRQNLHLRKIFENIFGMKMQIPKHKEEASYGAALYALTASGVYPSLEKAQELIRYM